MNHYWLIIKTFCLKTYHALSSRFGKITDALETIYNWGVKVAKHYFRTDTRTKPEKIWCFYRDPYRQGIAATVLTGALVLTAIAVILFLIGVITSIVLLFAITVFLVAIVVFFGGVVGGMLLGNKVTEDDSRGGLVGLIAGGVAGSMIATPVGNFGQQVWQSGIDFARNLELFIKVTTFIGQNWLWILLIIILPALIVFTIAALTILVVYTLRAVEQLVLWFYGIRYPCPECSLKTEPADYYCSECLEKHPHRLIPSQYGIFSQKCKNGHSLPTMLLLGRNQKVPHHCPHCDTDLSAGAVGTDKHIAFVGGQTSGKTCLLVQVTSQLLAKGAEIPEPEQKRDFLILKDRVDNGQVPDKTNPKNIYRAFQMVMKNGKFPYHIHFYDLAGEKFEDAKDAASHRFFTTLDAIVFAFDPYSIPEFKNTHLLPPGLGIATQDPLEIIRNLSQVLDRYNDKSRVRKISLNILLVKSDTGYLDGFVPLRLEQGQINEKIKKFMIEELGQAAFVHHIGQHFDKINFFRSSALGRTPSSLDSSPFISENLTETFDKIWKEIKMKVS